MVRACSHAVSCALVVASAGLAPSALAQRAGLPPERMDNPFVDPGELPTTPPFFSPRGFLTSVQVNVDGAGRNLVGDAANEPSIAVDPLVPNRIVIGFRQFDTIASNFRQAGYAYSKDGGRTWRMSKVEPGVFRSDPVLRPAPDGAIYWNMLYTTLGSIWRCDLYRSNDGGETWQGPRFALGGDKLWMAFDWTNTPSRGMLHQAWNTAGNEYFPNQYNRTLDYGQTWLPLRTITGSPVFGTCAVGPAGEFYVANGSGTLAVRKSTNANDPLAAVTFTTFTPSSPTHNGAGTNQPPNPGGLIGQGQVLVDTSTGPRAGYVYLLATVGGQNGTDIVFRRSTTGGTTWDPPVFFRGQQPPPQNSFQWFGTMGLAPDGSRIDVVYNDTSASNSVRISTLMYTSSSDGGVTWTDPLAMGPAWDSHLGWPNQNKIGDYYDIQSDNLGANAAYAATYTGGHDVYYLRIGPRDCDADGVSDAQEITLGQAQDCDSDGIPDACEIAAGAERDVNSDGVPDACPCDSIDFNRDGLTPDSLDLDDFLAVLGGGPSACSTFPVPGCNDIDFNNDGFSPDSLDLDAFLSRLAGGPCVD